MTASHLADIAEMLRGAERTGEPTHPVVETQPDLTVADAYAIQLQNVEKRLERGERLAGHKVGLTSLAMQRALGVHEPDFGHLFAGMFYTSNAPIATGAFIAPRVEPEVAFVLGSDLTGPQLTLADAIRAVDFVLPALEIIDSRIADWKITLIDTVADNASSAGVVLGPQPHRLGDHDLAEVPCTFTRGSEVVGTGLGSDVLGHPLHALLWLANRLGDLGTPLKAGHIVLPGSCTVAADVRPGDVFRADFGPLGAVTATFAEEPET